ncbi:MAG TPA: aminotransferase class V-fold PLP-dependent enzyme [Jatrophihabitans sp.]|nr:aminotransferase class V-fold PLP-dependent enzyme [Jatrophihabitans sp.]
MSPTSLAERPGVRYRLADLAAAQAGFFERHPDFDPDGGLAELRRTEYGRLDAANHVYLDYTGGGLHAESQLKAHAELLGATVLGNPHSNNPTSRATTALVESTRRRVLEFFNAPPDEYACIFTPNASGALRLVGEAYPFARGATFALTFDNHNSVNGIREFARRKGADIAYVPVVAPDLRVDRSAMARTLRAARPASANLLAFPAQSNYSGVQHPLEIVAEAQEAGWDVLLDAAAFAPTNRVDIDRIRPDFATFSFYKMFGYPTGIGCLLARRDKLARLVRPWFAGGTVTIASVQGDGHYLQEDEAAFEDGTVDYLNIPAVAAGLDHLQRVGVAAIHHRVMCLTGWLLDALAELRHGNGQPLVRILGPVDTTARGGTVTIQLRDPHGRPIDDRRVEELAGDARISLRTGCFCNPGAGEVAHDLTRREMRPWFTRAEPVSFSELREQLLAEYGVAVAAIRVSVGLASTFSDVFRLLCFVQRFVDRSAEEVGRPDFMSPECRMLRDSA